MSTTGTRTREQERAAFAWEKIHEVKDERNDYGNLAKGAPALIMGNGLMAALAYYQAKSNPGKALVTHIVEWLHKMGCSEGEHFSDCMRSLHQSNATAYMQATREALEIVRWIRQFAAAVAKEG